MTNGHKLNMRKEAKKDMMVKFGKKIVKFRVPILILSILLLIPSALGYLHTRINYDVLTYLPDNIETMKGQDILVNDFGTGAFSMFIVDGMEDKDLTDIFLCNRKFRYNNRRIYCTVFYVIHTW